MLVESEAGDSSSLSPAPVEAVGVKRPNLSGNRGKHIVVSTNFFEITIPNCLIHQYDGLSPTFHLHLFD